MHFAPHLEKCLTELDFRHTDVGESGAAAMAHLTCLKALHKLILRNAGICDSRARVLAKPICTLTALKHLDLFGNSLWYDGVVALAGQLAKVTTLTRLDLRGNKICVEGFRMLAHCILRLPSLKCFENFQQCRSS